MTRALAYAALIFVAGCTQQENEPPVTDEAARAQSAPAAAESVPALEGSWNIAAIDGQPVAAGSAMRAEFAGGKVSIASGCIRRGLTYTQKGNVVSFEADPGGSSNCEGRGTSAQHETAYAALQSASMAIFDEKGTEASLSGTGGNVTLRRR